jgi:hypothetical protein
LRQGFTLLQPCAKRLLLICAKWFVCNALEMFPKISFAKHFAALCKKLFADLCKEAFVSRAVQTKIF